MSTEKHLYKELSSYLGKCRKDEAVTPLLVKIWFSLQSVTNGRKFLLQKVLSGEASGTTNNPIVTRLIKACETSKSNYEADPNVMAASLYLIASNYVSRNEKNLVCCVFVHTTHRNR